MRKIRIGAISAAALLVASCGMPIGFQVASLVIDAISFAATEKTITDHGLSMVADKDCAIWRSVKGEDICHDTSDESGEILTAEALEAPTTPMLDSAAQADPTPIAGVGFDQDTSFAEARITETSAPLLADDFAEMPKTTEPETATPDAAGGEIIVAEVVIGEVAASDTPVIAPEPRHRERVEGVPTDSQQGGTFLVIASYHRVGDAERYAKNQTRLKTRILSGTATGKSVFRVAVGPVSSPSHRRVKKDLIKSGYSDVWALKLKNPQVIVELASLH